MGCCFSSPSSSPYPSNQASSSSRAITSSQPQSHSALPRPSTNASSHSNHNQHRHHRHQQPLSAHITQPLRPHVWQSNGHLWTRRDLDRERIEFFDTRVTGRPEIWLVIRSALEVLWAGGDAQDEDGGLATAQQILGAGEVTIPSGNLVDGVYDALGAYYQLPAHIVSDPTNLVPSPEETDDTTKHDEGEEEQTDEEEILRRREAKGKGVISAKDLIHVTARLSDGGAPDLVIQHGRSDSVRLLVQRIMDGSGLTPPKSIRIAYMGKMLEPGRSLTSQGWKEGQVVNAYVFG